MPQYSTYYYTYAILLLPSCNHSLSLAYWRPWVCLLRCRFRNSASQECYEHVTELL